jgi:ATP synthase subunit 6
MKLNMNLISSPLEQFQIIPLFSSKLATFELTVTNSVMIIFLGLFAFYFFFSSLKNNYNSYQLVPNRWQAFIEGIYEVIAVLLKDTVGKKGQEYLPYMITLFSFILVANLIGLIPYSFTITSHLIVTFSLALLSFIGINLTCIKKHELRLFSLFLPGGTELGLAFILVPIEIVSYFVRPISLSVRLFANMMAGHTLMKVIAGFAWNLGVSGGGGFILHFIPIIILILVMGLEAGVALIQSYVFTILICIYLNDAIHLH